MIKRLRLIVADEPVSLSLTAETLKEDLLSKSLYDKWQRLERYTVLVVNEHDSNSCK